MSSASRVLRGEMGTESRLASRLISFVRELRAMVLLGRLLLAAALLGTVGSTLWRYPHQLAYFNELAGGPACGWRHMLGSSLDWGQDVLHVPPNHTATHGDRSPLLFYGSYDPRDFNPSLRVLQWGPAFSQAETGGGIIRCRGLVGDQSLYISVAFAAELGLPLITSDGAIAYHTSGHVDPFRKKCRFLLKERLGASILEIAPVGGWSRHQPTYITRRTVHGHSHLARALRPRSRVYHLSGQHRISEIAERLRPHEGASLSQWLHAWFLFGEDLTIVTQSDVQSFLAHITSSSGADSFGGGHLFVRTDNGATVPLYDPHFMSTDQRNAQAHRGQLLSLMGAMSVPLETRISFSLTDSGCISDLVKDVQANWLPEAGAASESLYWEAVVLALYVPPHYAWTNKFGERCTLDQVALQLLRATQDPPATLRRVCGGTHAYISLVTLCNVDDEHFVLTPSVRRRVDSWLQDTVTTLSQSQLTSGGWTTDWDLRAPMQNEITFNPTSFVIATGHHLEWLLTAPDSIEVQPELIERAGKHLLQWIDALTEDSTWVHNNHCPATHAVRSLRLMCGT